LEAGWRSESRVATPLLPSLPSHSTLPSWVQVLRTPCCAVTLFSTSSRRAVRSSRTVMPVPFSFFFVLYIVRRSW
ncbi:hypothetical protein J6590_053795, partial [Homalodisca vitripennis]